MKHALMLASLALKNLTRHKRRTIITATALAMGLGMFILFDSLLTGLENDGVRTMIWYDTAGLQVQNAAYWEDKDLMPLDAYIANPEAIIARLSDNGYDATPRAVFSGEMIVNKDPWPESGSVRARFFAIDPARDTRVFKLQECVQEGHWLSPGEEGIVIGAQMAKDLGAEIGFPVTIVTRTRDGAYQTMDFTVTGIINTPNAAVNRLNIFMDLSVADDYLELAGTVNQVAIAFDEERDAVREASVISKILETVEPNLTVLPWKITGEDFLAFVQSRQGLSKILLLLVFIIAAVGVSNTMLLTILERRREIGMLRAQGMQDSEVMICLLMEAGMIGLIGGILGLLISLPYNIHLIDSGLDVSSLMNSVGADLPFTGRLRGAWHPQTMIFSVLIGIVLSVAVSIFPVRRSTKMQITDCLRQN